MKPRILLIEDDAGTAASLQRVLRDEGYEVDVADRGDTGLERARQNSYSVVITDLRLPGLSGLELVAQLHALKPKQPILLMTAHGTTETAIEATKLGAYDYLLKPFEADELLDLLGAAVASSRLMSEPVEMGEASANRSAIVGQGKAMQAIYKEVGRVAATPATVLIRGATGTGKELIARAIYQHSDRADKPFIAVNCAAIPDALLESELFGHERGAFTGAQARRIGRFEQAHGGTLFLDEIGDLNANTQGKLLRVLQERCIQRLGSEANIPVDVRVLAAGITWATLVRQHRLGIQKSNFVAGVSHELRAPLASVRLLADNLENDRVAEPERRTASLRLIGRECRRLGALVDNVLDLSRIERGTKRIEPEPTDIPALVRATVASATVGAGERGVTIREAFAPDCVALVASVDPSAFQQALTNLLDNAVKHAPDGTEVIVGLERVASDPRRFAVVVSDSGPGVPESDRRRVFEPFVRLGNELRREQPGIGIGLAIVRHVVEAHGGRVRVEAASPRGARFVLELPVGLDEAGEDGSGGGAS